MLSMVFSEFYRSFSCILTVFYLHLTVARHTERCIGPDAFPQVHVSQPQMSRADRRCLPSISSSFSSSLRITQLASDMPRYTP